MENKTEISNCNEHYRQFTGTEEYHQFMMGLVLSDGVAHIANDTGSFWFLDIIASYQVNGAVRKHNFQTWTLKRIEGNKFQVVATEGNDVLIAKQNISFSDFKYDIYTIWKRENVLYLPSEN